MIEISLPELGEGITKAVVSCWYVHIGDCVKQGEDIVEVVVDKATFNIEAPQTGIVKDILATEGQEITVGGCLAKMISQPKG